MRRHESNISKKIMVYFIGFIMVFSAFGVVFFGFGSSNILRYNDFKFVNKGNLWAVNIEGREALFTYSPASVELIPVEDNAVDKLKGMVQIDTTSEFNDTFAKHIALAQFQMGATLNNFGVFLRSGFIGNSSNFPIIKCEDATSFVPVLYFKSSNKTRVYLNESCVVAEVINAEDVLRIKDRLVYGILKVIK